MSDYNAIARDLMLPAITSIQRRGDGLCFASLLPTERQIAVAIAEAVKVERAACARIYPKKTSHRPEAWWEDGWREALREFRRLIRARSEVEPE